jgi:hypothetical protein
MDVIVTGIGDRPLLLRNRSTTGNHWLTLSLEGTQSNRDGFGARVKLAANGKELRAQARCTFGFLMQSDRRLHFGLGKTELVERLEIRWPSGQVQEIRDIRANQVFKVREPGERHPVSTR